MGKITKLSTTRGANENIHIKVGGREVRIHIRQAANGCVRTDIYAPEDVKISKSKSEVACYE